MPVTSQGRDLRLAASQVAWRCDETALGFSSTEHVAPPAEILGQERAIEALTLALEIEADGYNTFVAGEPGTGRSTAVRSLVERYAAGKPAPPDLCYVHNFHDPYMPRALRLQAGLGRRFREDMHNLVGSLRTKLPLLLESDQFSDQRRAVIERRKEREQALHRDLEREVTEASFALAQVQVGSYTRPELVVVIEEQPVTVEQLDGAVAAGKLSAERAQSLREKYRQLSVLLESVFKQSRALEREVQIELERIAHELAKPLVHGHVADLTERYPCEEVCAYLDEVEASVLSNLDAFAKTDEDQQAQGEERFLSYSVNVVVDNGSLRGAPVVFETAPTYTNLFGLIEKSFDRSGQVHTDFTKIKAGSFLRASGGYLVLNAMDVLTESGVWNTLKRTLRNRRIEVHTFEPLYGLPGNIALKPEHVPCDVKVIMLGDPELYQMLYGVDTDFKKIFKIKAEFDSEMPRSTDGMRHYPAFIRKIVDEAGLPHFDASGVAAMMEFGVATAGRKSKLSTRFSVLADLAREAAHVTRTRGGTLVSRSDVDDAIRKRDRRVSLVDDKIQEMITQGVKWIETSGAVVGQVNGLAVYGLSDHVFGKPARISASIAMGQAGIVSIEREVELSGSTHSKGVLILTGFLRGRFAARWPLALSATLCFEQSYSEVDGDSASSAEVYAMLSALSGAPIRQDVAVTGAVDQWGNILPVGGVNEKVEGFFRLCRDRGLTGAQGVLVPSRNIDDLHVAAEIVDAVEGGRFAIWAIDHVDRGIEILTGIPSGARGRGGRFPKETINGLTERRLRELADGLRRFDQPIRPRKRRAKRVIPVSAPHDSD
ncbi:MAG: AAA family ATPase [Candidatus Eisenbacteria bacterium]|nr:AAA family ATPase [Candidatus Eisenbacteria bacterium]